MKLPQVRSWSASLASTNFIWFKPHELFERISPKASEYIRLGEREELHKRYKCRIRTPWYAVPSVYATSVGMLKRSHHYPRLIYNKAKAFTTDTAYRVTIKKGFSEQSVVGSFVNSMTVLSAELEGRHYGGGVLELVPSEIEKLLVPIRKFTTENLKEQDLLFRSKVPHEEILNHQDKFVLESIGFDKEMCEILHNAWRRLSTRRQR